VSMWGAQLKSPHGVIITMFGLPQTINLKTTYELIHTHGHLGR